MLMSNRMGKLVPATMNYCLIFVIIGKISCVDDENPLQFSVWKETRHAKGKPLDDNTLYARERHCQPPERLVALQSHSHEETSWSIMFSRYTFDAFMQIVLNVLGGEEFDSWLKNQEVHPETEKEKHTDDPIEKYIPVVFPFFFIFFLAVCVLVIPVLGALGFQIVEVCWWVFTHQEIKRAGRYILILNEKMSRRRQKILMPESLKRIPKSRFRLPAFFRIHSDEDVPPDLEESDTDKDWLADAVPSDEEHDEKFSDEGASLSGLESEVAVANDAQGNAAATTTTPATPATKT